MNTEIIIALNTSNKQRRRRRWSSSQSSQGSQCIVYCRSRESSNQMIRFCKYPRDQRHVPSSTLDLSFAASLSALRQSDGWIRPVVVGNVQRRLVQRTAAKRIIPILHNELPPVQQALESMANERLPLMQFSNVEPILSLDLRRWHTYRTNRCSEIISFCQGDPSVLCFLLWWSTILPVPSIR